MASYELTNRLEWDQDQHSQHKEAAGDSDWTLVQKKKERPTPVRPRQNQQQRHQNQQQRHQNQPSKAANSQALRAPRSQREPSRKWQATHFQNLIHKPTRRSPERLGSETGNTGEAEWRTGVVGPVNQVKIPDDLCLQNTYFEQIARIATEHDTFIFSEHKHGSGGSRTFGIWGDRTQAAKTRNAIADWIDAVWGSNKSDRSARFAKVVSLTPRLRQREEKRWIRAVAKQRFRQHPPADMVFQSIGDFHWPSDEYTPEEILGASYEALDPLRMECKCYVVYRSERKTFRIMGEIKAVQKGMDRLRKCFYQIASRQVTGPRKYLLRWPAESEMPTKVTLNAYEYPAAPSSKAPEVRAGKTPRGADYLEDEDFTFQSSIQTDINHAKARTCILKTLPKLHYYRGNLQLRLRLGTFVVDQFRSTEDGSYSLAEYEDMVRESQFIGHVTQEVGDKNVEPTLLEKFQEAVCLITPSNGMTQDLKAVQPIISVIFTFADKRGDLRLNKEWQLSHDLEDFDVCFEKWSRLDAETGTLRTLLDVSMTNLTNSQAWQIDISACDSVDDTRLPTALRKFAASVKIVPAVAKAQAIDRPFVTYNPYRSLKSIQQRVSYRYIISGTDYTLDLTRFQNITIPSSSPATGTANPSVYEARWSINVFRTVWNTMFAENEKLGIGACATWQDDVVTWFPRDIGPESGDPDGSEDGGEGWDQLLEKLEKIEGIVKDAKASLGADLIGGMDVV